MKRLIKKSSETIELMHGTNSTIMDSVLQNGIIPSGFTSNFMFNYNDYGRKGEPKHPDCIYLTNDLENAKRYSANAVKHNKGFPVVMKVEVETDALTWDDDAFYKSYNEFDFAEKDFVDKEFISKPNKELWEQSLEINKQCSHHGIIKKEQIKEIFLNGKWISINDFIQVFDTYKNIEIKSSLVNSSTKFFLKDFVIDVIDKIKCNISFIDRNIYLYNLNEVNMNLSNFEKTALSVKIMEFLKENIKEFGATIIYSSEFKQIGFNPKTSCLGYIFGIFEVKSEKDILTKVVEDSDDKNKKSELLSSILNCTAEEDEFNLAYEYSVDFVGDLVEYCKNFLQYDNNKIINVLHQVKQKYNDAYNQLDAEIEYLKVKKEAKYLIRKANAQIIENFVTSYPVGYEHVDKGIQVINVDDIIGMTMGRHEEYDENMQPIGEPDDRWKRLYDEAKIQGSLDFAGPVRLVKLPDEEKYFVYDDGNHRVSVAKSLGIKNIQAEVFFLVSKNKEENKDIEDQMEEIKEQINNYQKELDKYKKEQNNLWSSSKLSIDEINKKYDEIEIQKQPFYTVIDDLWNKLYELQKTLT